jgi:hypothetical protein
MRMISLKQVRPASPVVQICTTSDAVFNEALNYLAHPVYKSHKSGSRDIEEMSACVELVFRCFQAEFLDVGKAFG